MPVEKNANSGLEYKEVNPVTPTNYLKEVIVSIIFSPFSYDLLKDYADWKYLDEKAIEYSHRNYVKFVSLMEWHSSKGYLNVKEPKTKDDVPANDKASDRAKAIEQNEFNMTLFVDCSRENGSSAVNYKNEDLEGYLSMAMSEIKDHLFRLHRKKHFGNVKFVISAYQPLSPLVFAFLDFAGIRIKDCSKYDEYITPLKANPWFTNFKPWLERYDWKPDLKEAAVFQGHFYGMSEETQYSKYHRRSLRYQAALRVMYKFNGEVLHNKPSSGVMKWDEDEIKKWKEVGGRTVKRDSFFDNDDPAIEVDGELLNEKRLIELRNYCDRMSEVDPSGSPARTISYNPRTGRGETKNRLDSTQKVDSREMIKEFDAWVENTYNPQMQENQSVLNRINAKKTDKDEIWSRKKAEDENVSDQWSADDDHIEYHGKMVHKSFFQGKVDKLNAEYNSRVEAINDQKKREALQKWLTALSLAQLVLAIASFGATAPLAILTIAVVDIGLEIGKAYFQFKYDKDYNMTKALWEHTLGIVMDGISCIMCLAALNNLRKINKAAKATATEAKNVPAPKTAPNEVKTPTPSPSNDGVIPPVKAKGEDYEILGMTTKKDKAMSIPDDGAMHIDEAIANDKPVWVKIKKSDGTYDVITGKPSKMKEISGKDPNEWASVAKSKKEAAPNGAENASADRLDELKKEANATFTDANVSFDKMAKQGYDPATMASFDPNVTPDGIPLYEFNPPPVSIVTETKIDQLQIPSFKEQLAFFGQPKINPEVVKPNSYHIHGTAKSIEETGFGQAVTQITTIYTGYSAFNNYIQIVSTDGISYKWANDNIDIKPVNGVKMIDGKELSELFEINADDLFGGTLNIKFKYY